jgi:hypothetical protein
MKMSKLLMYAQIKHLFCFCVFVVFVGNVYSQENCFSPGLNAHPLFINKFRHFGNWNGTDGLELDKAGYPYHLPEETSIRCYTSRGRHLWEDSTFICRWDGEGTVSFSDFYGANVVIDEERPRYIRFHVTYDGHDKYYTKWEHVWLAVTGSNLRNLRPGTDYNPNSPADAGKGHVRNIRIYLQSHENLYESQGEVFDPFFIEKAKSFYTFRFMGAFHTNSKSFEWSKRTPPEWRNQTSGPHGAGLAFEWAIRLCNETKTHLWFNVHHTADNASILKMAEIVRDNLDPDLNVYLEYGNETWNTSKPYRWGWEYVRAHGGVRAGHARLSLNVFKIWRKAFSHDSLRVKRVMATQAANVSIGRGRIEAIGAENIDIFSPTYYYGGNTGEWDKNTTQDQMIEDYYENIRGGKWYQNRKENATLAKEYGLDLFCYEGGTGGDPRDTIPSPTDDKSYPYWRTYIDLQTNPEMRLILNEVIDSLASLGYKGGNELGLTGMWKYLPNKQVGFWGCMNHVWNNAADYPKYQGYVDRMKDCDNLIRESDTIGSGMAIRLDGHDDYIEAKNGFKPNDATNDYAFEFWLRPERLDGEQYLVCLSKDLQAAGNSIMLSNANRITWTVRNNSGTPIASINGPVVTIGKWYHVVASKSTGTYTLFVNGVKKGSMVGGVSGDCSRSRFVIGAKVDRGQISAHFRGRIDEMRVWNSAVTNISTIRSWMCKKLTSAHPQYSNLINYYRFDIVNTGGEVKEIGRAHV